MPRTFPHLNAFRIASANLWYGGIDRTTGSDASWRRTIAALAPLRLHAVCLQEITTPDPAHLWRHTHRTAEALGGMQSVLGPSAAIRASVGGHTAIMVHPGAARLVDQWPPVGNATLREHWCSAEVAVPGLDEPLHVYCVHLSARSQIDKLRVVQILTSIITEHSQLAVILGDLNCYPADPVDLSELETIDLHLQMGRCVVDDAGELVPDLSVHNHLTRAGLVDVAAYLPARHRDPEKLVATGHGGARIDRCYAVGRLADTACRYQQVKTGGDHDAGVWTFDLGQLVEGQAARIVERA